VSRTYSVSCRYSKGYEAFFSGDLLASIFFELGNLTVYYLSGGYSTVYETFLSANFWASRFFALGILRIDLCLTGWSGLSFSLGGIEAIFGG